MKNLTLIGFVLGMMILIGCTAEPIHYVPTQIILFSSASHKTLDSIKMIPLKFYEGEEKEDTICPIVTLLSATDKALQLKLTKNLAEGDVSAYGDVNNLNLVTCVSLIII